MSSDPLKEAFLKERQRMVVDQLRRRDIRDERILKVMESVPRHCFVPRRYRHLAYTDGPLPIGRGQTISQPYIVALMTQLLDLRGDEKVLEVGTGSGYQAAVLSRLAREVYTIERHAELARRASRILLALGYHNIQVHVGDGSQGLAEFAPFDGILVTAAAPGVPPPLLNQLSERGVLVLPVGSLGYGYTGGQVLEKWCRQPTSPSGFNNELVTSVAFVPLIGRYGWQE